MKTFSFNLKITIVFIVLSFIANKSLSQEEYVLDDTTKIENKKDTLLNVVTVKESQKFSSLKSRIDKLLDSDMFKTSSVGIEVYDLTDNTIVYKHNERLLLRPASTMKMITAVTALEYLGASYKYSTTIYYTGNIENGCLEGDLYCKGGFDPMLDLSDLKIFVEKIKALGIDTIRGRVYQDLSMKDSKLLGEGWCWDDDNPKLTPLVLSRRDDFKDKFLQRLKTSGIYYQGSILTASVPSSAKVIYTLSRSIGDVLKRMMKKSDNLYAESMFYQLSPSRPATAKLSRQRVNQLIKKFYLNPEDYYIADGSGLSLYNYVTAQLEVEFLKWAYRNSDIYQPLYNSMPIAGVDGTLEYRMTTGKAYNNVHAKTGTVTKISALAGYLKASNGHILCFSIINNGVEKASTARGFQDSVCEELCK